MLTTRCATLLENLAELQDVAIGGDTGVQCHVQGMLLGIIETYD